MPPSGADIPLNTKLSPYQEKRGAMRVRPALTATSLLLVALLCFGCEEDCDNGVDDDGDSFIDCKDFSCSADPFCHLENCTNERDDDDDGLVDCRDDDCVEKIPFCE